MLWIDFETTSETNLTVHGVTRYAQDPTTEVLCLGWAIDDGEVSVWYPEDSEFPQEVIDRVIAGDTMYAHNATFDRLVWEYMLSNDFAVPLPALSQWRCSQARAMAQGLPGALGNLCKAIDLPIQKQTEGKRLIRDYSCNGRVDWMDDDKQLMTDYCAMDIRTMRMACSVMRELTTSEWAEYHLNERINERGIPIDVEFATAALNYASDVKRDVNGQIQELTNGAVKSALARKTRDAWIFARITPDQKELLSVYKNDVKKYSLDQEHRNQLLEADNLDRDVEALVSLMNDAGGSSTSKYTSMVNTHVDGRVCNALVWHGAATGRWTSKGIQLHNMPRKAYEEPEALIQDVLGDYEVDRPASTLSKLLRATITAPEGITFGDWSAIEGRICPWLSDDYRAQGVLDVFRRDEDIYIATAAGMGMDDRQAGKVAALSMQFAGGAGALQRMAKVYGVVYTLERAEELKCLWRSANKWAVDFWWGLLNAAKDAYKTPGVPYTCGKLTFQYDGGDWLWMRRPSGNLQGYFQPKIELVEYPWGGEGYELTALAGSVKPKAGKAWPRRALTPGTLIENATQGTAADLMRFCVTEGQHLPIIGHVHDELIVEGEYINEVQELMDRLPTWAAGLPIKAEVKHKQRYGK